MSAKIFIEFRLVIFLYVILYLRFIQSDYCRNELCKEHNVACNEQAGIPASHCIDYEKTIKTEREKEAILNKINSRRNKVAQGEIRSLAAAGNMLKLEWSANLESAAQRWADQCVGKSTPDMTDKCLNFDTEGQNIATIYGEAPGLSPLVLVDVWYMELLHLNSSIVSQYIPSAETGLSHYDYFTQLVWAGSNYVGCGSVKFKEPKEDVRGGTYRIVNRLVCNFSPAGNRRHKPVYLKGAPCSLCPGGCDAEYNALCKTVQPKLNLNTEVMKNVIDFNKTGLPELNDSAPRKIYEITQISNDSNDDDIFTPYNFLNSFKPNEPSTMSPTKKQQCKDLAVDDFVDLLKKKLSSDPMFKELASKSHPQTGDVINTDPNVAAFVSKVYSKRVPSTTTRSTENDFINSTLLVDLVEAVIFRSGDKIPSTEEPEVNAPVIEVNPIKIKAELSEIKLNQDFTGHYFFPQDDNDDGDFNPDTAEITETYEEISTFPMSDIALEIEDFKLIKTTRDFLEEILESEAASERHVIRHKRDSGKEKKNINTIQQYKGGYHTDMTSNQLGKRHASSCVCNTKSGVIKYSNLLQQIALDLKVLKLSERFHCTRTRNFSGNNRLLLFTKILCTVLLKVF